MDQAYLSMGYKGQTKKQLAGTMQGTYSGGKKEKSQEPKIDDLRNKYGY
jgi:hypothetical protein